MVEKYEEGQEHTFEITQLVGESRGLAWTPDDRVVIIDGISEDDTMVRAKITRVLEESLLADNVQRIRTESSAKKIRGAVESPYGIDDDEDDDDDSYDDDEEDDDSD